MAFLEKFGRRLGVLEYLGAWDASTNTPTLVSGIGQKNGYYVVSFSGSTNLDGITDWDPGDWAIFNGVAWEQIDNQVFNGAHANLSGLLNDDHTQYFNETRGDLRYEQKNSNIQTHIASTSNPHSVTKAQVGLGSVDNVSAASLRDRSTHTGTQPASTISDFTTAVQGVNIAATQIGSGVVSNTEFETLDGINTGSTIQTQLDGKQPTGNYITALTGDVTASGPGSATATLANSGVTAGTYDQVTVDVKGRVTAGTVDKYYSVLGAQVTNTANTYTTIAGLTSATLPVGLYSFQFFGLSQSAATSTGVGFRISNVSATVSTMYGKWFIDQAANGTAQSFQYAQLANNTNVTSASSIVASTNFSVTGFGVFRVTAQGTVAIQIRSETAGTQVLIQPDAVLEIKKIG